MSIRCISVCHKSSRPGRVVGLIAVLALLLAACGSDGGSSTDTSPSSTAAPTGSSVPGDDEVDIASMEQAKVRVVMSSSSLAQAPWYVAEGAGFFEDLKLEIEFLPDLPRTPEQLELVVRGDVEVSHGAPTGLFVSLANGRPVRGIGVGATGSPLILILRQQVVDRLAGEGVTPASPPQERVDALKGLTIGTTAAGGGLHTLVLAMLAEFGLEDGRDLTIFPAETPALFAALRQGQIDGLVFSPPSSLEPVNEGLASVWLNGVEGDVTVWSEGFQQFSSAAASALDENPDVYARVVAALELASRFMQSDPEAAMEAARPRFADLDSTLFEESFRAIAPAFPTAFVSELKYEQSLEQHNLSADEPLEGMAFAETFDLAVVELAKKIADAVG